MFNGCENIIERDLSNFDCSQVTSCESMFRYCDSLKKFNLGILDFAHSFENMFYNCRNLEELDVSHFNTKNSLTFKNMFVNCEELKVIDVSKFDSSKCITIDSIFWGCRSLSEIDMINWDISSIEPTRIKLFSIFSREEKLNIFSGCKNLKKIKMSSTLKNIFRGLPENGKFYWRKGINYNGLLNALPVSWNREQE